MQHVKRCEVCESYMADEGCLYCRFIRDNAAAIVKCGEMPVRIDMIQGVMTVTKFKEIL
jgi:hypothetical protein